MEKLLTNYVSSIHEIICNDQQPEIQKINKFINKVANAVTLSNSNDVAKQLKVIRRQVPPLTYIELCHSLLCRKYYILIPIQKRSFEEMQMDNDHIQDNKRKLINHTRVVHIFWEYFEKKIDYLLEQLVKSKMYLFPLMIDNFWSNGLDAWRNIYVIFKEMMQTIAPVIQYINSNYPNIFSKYINKYDNFENYLIYKFYNTIRDKLNQRKNGYDDYLKFSISNLIRNGNDITEKININVSSTLFKYAALFNETIDGQPIKDYYTSTLKNYLLSEDFKRSIFQQGSQGFTRLFLQRLKEQTLLSALFSPTWMENVKNLIVETILMNKDVINEYYKFFKSNNSTSTKIVEINDFEIFYFTFASRSKINVLNEIVRDIIYEEMIQYYTPDNKTCLVTIFDNLTYQVLCFSNSNLTKFLKDHNLDSCTSISNKNETISLRDSYIKLFGNELNLCQAIVQYIILKGKSLSSLSPSKEANYNLSQFVLVLENTLKYLLIPSSITVLYSEALFRYILMNYSDLIQNMANYDTNESRIIQFIDNVTSIFKKVYNDDCKPLTLMWQHLKEHMSKVCKLHELAPGLNDFYPLILPQVDVPEMYQRMNEENSLNNVRLPAEIREVWEKFEKEYKGVILTKGEHKEVHPLYGLQYCSVETPFLRENGEPVVVELSLHQTCVLNEFNEVDRVSLRQLVERLQMEENQVKAALNSFLKIGLVKINKDRTFSVNEKFKVEERKLRNGVLRVVMGKRMTKPLGGSSRGRKHGAASGGNDSGDNDCTGEENTGKEHGDWAAGHHEGSSSTWRREVIKACIVRTVKSRAHNEAGISEEDLMDDCLHQLLEGISIGEFQDALSSAVHERYITRTNNGEYVFDM